MHLFGSVSYRTDARLEHTLVCSGTHNHGNYLHSLFLESPPNLLSSLPPTAHLVPMDKGVVDILEAKSSSASLLTLRLALSTQVFEEKKNLLFSSLFQS